MMFPYEIRMTQGQGSIAIAQFMSLFDADFFLAEKLKIGDGSYGIFDLRLEFESSN